MEMIVGRTVTQNCSFENRGLHFGDWWIVDGEWKNTPFDWLRDQVRNNPVAELVEAPFDCLRDRE